jgi:excisionase family DNA binding protein
MVATSTRRLVSLGDTAEMLAVSTKTVRRYIADGHLDAVRLGRKTIRIRSIRSSGSSTHGRWAGGGASDEWFRGSLRSHLNHRGPPAKLVPQPPHVVSRRALRALLNHRARGQTRSGTTARYSSYVPQRQIEALERASDLRVSGGRYWV